MEQEIVIITRCVVCSAELEDWRLRSDGMLVRRCPTCTMGTVAAHPADLSVLYDDGYYSNQENGYGYDAYDDVGSASLPWVCDLIHRLKPSGKVLDVGCADGRVLDALGSAYTRSGIEVNQANVEECRRKGITIVARDIADPRLRALAGTFDVVVALAVLEHVPNIRAAMEAITSLLAPGGIMIVQTPLLHDDGPDDPWLTSSFEHISYPTIKSLHVLFEDVFALHLVGDEVEVRGFGAEFVGIATADAQLAAEINLLWDHLLLADIASLSRDDLAFRFYFRCLYLADRTPELLRLLPDALIRPQTRGVLTRLARLWAADVDVVDSVKAISEARDWHAEQSRQWQREFDAVLEARDWHAGESKRWQERYSSLVAERTQS